MGGDKPNNGDNPPWSSIPLQENHDSLTITPSEAAVCSMVFHSASSAGADHMSFPYMPLPDAPPYYQSYMHGTPDTGGNLMADFMKFHSLQNLQIDPNSLNTRSNFTTFPGPSEFSPPVRNMQGMHHPIHHDNMVTPDNVMIGGCHLSNFQNPQMNRIFRPTSSNVPGACQMNREGGVAKGILFHTDNRGGKKSGNNVKVSAVQFGCPEETDGSLTLGIGGNTEARSKPNFYGGERSSKLKEAVSPQVRSSEVQQTTRIGDNPEATSKSRFDTRLIAGKLKEVDSPDFCTYPIQQTTRNASSMGHNLAGGWTSYHNDFGVKHCANIDPSSNPIPISQIPQTDMGNTFFTSSNRYSGFGDARISDLDPCKSFQDNQTPSSLPFSSTSDGFLRLGKHGFSGLATESGNPSWIMSQPTSNQLQHCYNKNFPEYSMNSSFLMHRESSARPRRDHSDIVHQPQGSCPAQFTQNSVRPPFAIDRQQETVPAQFSTSLPCSSTGQSQEAFPVQFSKDRLRPVSITGQGIPVASVKGHSQASNVLSLGSLKRGAVQSPPAAHWAHRRKITHQPPLHPSMPYVLPMRTPPAAHWVQHTKISHQPATHPSMPYAPQSARAPVPIPATALAAAPAPAPATTHIERQGFGRPPQPMGHKCQICKRDLSFTPNGTVCQPAVPPVVAILPCGHTFHDLCLQNITPEDQANDPPCIACAISET